MRKHIHAVAFYLGISMVVVVAGAVGLCAQTQAQSSIDEIRHELLQLPYYGVFDFLAFKYDKGTVVLMGYAYHPSLKVDAQRAVKRAPGVDEIKNAIEELPPSAMDDDLRWKVYYSIYRDPFLSRYAPGGGMLWGHRHALGGVLHPFGSGPFSGMEPAGDYPIHIVVQNGHVTLLGVVDNEGDKTLAYMKARQVPGSFDVKNELMVEGKNARSTSH